MNYYFIIIKRIYVINDIFYFLKKIDFIVFTFYFLFLHKIKKKKVYIYSISKFVKFPMDSGRGPIKPIPTLMILFIL